MIKAFLTWFHRLHCAAWAFRGANSVMTLATGESVPAAACRRCGDMRLLERCGGYVAGQVFWSPDQ